MDIFNNLVYNWGGRTTDGGAHEVNFVNNYYRPGAASHIFYALNAQYDNFPGTQQYYFTGNVMPGHFDESTENNGREATNGTGTVPTSYSPWMPRRLSSLRMRRSKARKTRSKTCSRTPARTNRSSTITTRASLKRP